MAGTERGVTDESETGVPAIVRTEGVLGGDPRIEGTRIAVFHVYTRYVDGEETPAEIATGFDVSLSAVHAALAYGFANPDEMETLEARRRREPETGSNRVRPPDEE